MPQSPSKQASASNLRQCTVQLLDDAAIQVNFKKSDMGSAIFDRVCDELSLVEKDYFGLRFMDHNLHRYWLDPTKPILKQVKGHESIVFAFRVKFYPADPSILKEEFTRYLLVLQLRRDLLHGRLHCPQNDLAVLAAYIVQGELGDYEPDEHVGNYVSQFKILLNQTPKIEEKIAQAHKGLKSQNPADADSNFLKKAASLDTYGYYPYTIKDPKAGQVYLGATPKGILIYQTSRKLHHLKWSDIDGMDYSSRDFLIFPNKAYLEENQIDHDASATFNTSNHNATNGTAASGTDGLPERPSSAMSNTRSHISEKESKKKPLSLKFVCPSSAFSKQLWKYMLAEQAFFTSKKSELVKPVVKRSLLFRNSTFRWYASNRVLEELREADSPQRNYPPPVFLRSHVPRQVNRDDRSAPWANKFHTMPSRTKNPVATSDGLRASSEAPELGADTSRPTCLPRDDSSFPPLQPIDTVGQPSPNVSPILLAVVGAAAASVESASASDNTAEHGTVADGPIATSTPRRSMTPVDSRCPVELCAKLITGTPPTPLTTDSAAVFKGNLNGSTVFDASAPKSGRGYCAAFIRAIFWTVVTAMAACILIVAIMESDQLRPHVDASVLAHDFRRAVYTPARRFFVDDGASWFGQ